MIVPEWRLDENEEWRPIPVDSSLAKFGYKWEKGAFRKDGKEVSRIDFPSSMKTEDFKDEPIACYHRVAQAGRLYHHQFWGWWPFNPKRYPREVGIGEHEGDWELVQISCKDEEGDEPVVMTCSQHDGGERKFYWDVSLTEGKTGRPIVYVARDSHANYFTTVRTATDQCDGKGEKLRPEVLEFGPWQASPVQWGNSANSPGPLATRRAWRAPHAWTSQARG